MQFNLNKCDLLPRQCNISILYTEFQVRLVSVTEQIGLIVLPLRGRLRTHKVFTKDQCFYLNHHKFSIKSYVVDVF